MAEEQFVDDDDSVFKTHILYFVPDDQRCTQLIQFLDSHPVGESVWYQDVRKIPPNRRPQWMVRVPILVDKERKQAHLGRNIYQYLQGWGTEADDGNFLPADQFSGTVGNYEDFDSGNGVGGGPAGLNDVGTFTLEEDDERDTEDKLYTISSQDERRRSRQSEQVSGAQSYMSAREEQDRMFRERNQRMAGSVQFR